MCEYCDSKERLLRRYESDLVTRDAELSILNVKLGVLRDAVEMWKGLYRDAARVKR